MRWQEEFSDSYEVPAAITAALEDESWRNDSCPSFVVRGCPRDENGQARFKLWVEHPDPEVRECHGPRLVVSDRDKETDVWVGDDPVEAVRQIIEVTMAIKKLRVLSGSGTELMIFCVMRGSKCVFALWKDWVWLPRRGYYGFFSKK